ncbi:hypothetical protein C7974DRAFT_170033 [Boeremia exigua]|uniref:uncharacterized protein n=1 Tax=Boeremia exigua TaxID=749465 RepID=UPI001E8D35C6|nr:uncharacterized protein C7974DRAFT_170033 [Boeremia exigua]KAH6633358.1 hypothetical protein C7974DRAFT_170033 [Boeremia exigua]
MATPPLLRGSSLDHTIRAATPESAPAFKRSATSMSIPKSKCLRNVLEARRAQNTSAQNLPQLAAIDALPQRLATPSAPHTPIASPDAFDEFDLPEEIMTPESPIRKTRPHEKIDTPPRGRTNQELSAEVEKLRNELFKQNIRVELLNKSNHELQAKWVKAREEAEQLKPLAEENYELCAENKKLTERLIAAQDDIDHIDEISDEFDKLYLENEAVGQVNEALKKEVVNLTNINEEAVTNLQEMEEALDEAVEMITDLEGEKMQLNIEVDDLKSRVAAIETKQVDGSGYPLRVHSIDEQRPATSYDDSDYYSQPATPRAEVVRDEQSIRSEVSVRSKQFIELSKERARSGRIFRKRMSDVSLRAANLVSARHAPEIPYIPEEYAQVTPRMIDERFRERRYCHEPGVEHFIARSGAETRRPATVSPTQSQQPFALRSLRQPEQTRQPGTSRPSSSYVPGPNKSSRPRPRTHSLAEHYPAPPPRMSSRHAHTTSEDRPRLQTSEETLKSNTASGTLVGSEEQEQKQEQVLTTWVSANPRTSTVSLLTSPRIDGPDTERWWKDTEKVKPLRARATMRTLRIGVSSDGDGLGSGTFAARAAGIRTSPSTPATERPESDFLFNPRENEDQFMRKAIMRLKGSMRR